MSGERRRPHDRGHFVLRAPSGIDPSGVEAELERRLAERDEAPPAELPPPFAGAASDPLERARQIAARPGVAYEIGWRTPILGQAWAGLRQVVHDETRRYVDALMARQAELDAALLDAIADLRDEVERLRARLEERG